MSDQGPLKQKFEKPPRSFLRTWFIWILIFAMVVLIFELSGGAFNKSTTVSLQEFLTQIEAGNVSKVTFKSDEVEAEIKYPEGYTGAAPYQGKTLRYGAPYAPQSFELEAISKAISNANEKAAKQRTRLTETINDTSSGRLTSILLNIVPWIFLGLLFYFLFMRQFRAAGGQNILSFGKSRAKLNVKEHTRVTFDDVAGIDEAKEEVQEIVQFLKSPAKFRRLGGRLPRGVLLVGQPGTGKTLLAKAIAGEADTPFYSISGSDFVEMFVGVGASRVRDLFQQAKTNSPCIIFLDEIDAVGRLRGTGLGGGHDEREQTLNAILVEMDGFETDDNVIVIAATNRPDVLDPALLRPGRFDRQIVVDLPDVVGREAILKVHAKKIKLADEKDLKQVARSTPSFSGADLENLINEAAILATMRDKDAVMLSDMEEARDRVMWGREKRSKVIDENERRMTAFHEAGHAIVAHLLPDAEPLHKVTVIPRGMYLGATMSLPKGDSHSFGRKKALAEISTLMGGRVAEQLFGDDIEAGAATDLKRATELARKMVCQWGMSDLLGPVVYRDVEEHLFLGREVARTEQISAAIAEKIDAEVRRIIDECTQTAHRILSENSVHVQAVVVELLKREVLTAAEVDQIMHGQTLPPMPEASAAKPQATS